MIDCSAAVGRLWDYLERELTPADRAKFEEHLDFCRRCCGELEFAEELRRFMARTPDVELPPSLVARFDRLITELAGDGTQ
ncbi:MAG: zf-HC2 domain-containing protein [Acidimicrobiia bacterium]